MKNILIFCLIIFVSKIKAQVIFEYDYDSASTFSSGSPVAADQLQIVKFEVSGEKYIKINRHGEKILIYDMNHSLINSIDYSGFPVATPPNYNYFLYFSELLFDTDTNMEFIFCSSSPPYTGIYNEDGSLIFSDTGAVLTFASFPSQQYPIYNTSLGTKMILSYKNGHAKVFSLPGTLTTAIAQGNEQLMQAQGGQGQFSGLYPNPSSNSVTLQYQLPQGEPYGEIVLYNTQGAEVKRYKVDGTFNDILLDNTMLPAGTYFYQLQTAKGAVGTKKSIVVK